MFKKCKAIFEEYGDESTRNTFKGELNYECSKLFFILLIVMFVWIPYISTDIALHQFPKFAVAWRIGLSVLCVSLIALKFVRRFRHRPDIMMLTMVGFVYIGASIIAATSGEAASSYIGGFCYILMVATLAPFTLKAKFIISSFAYLLFMITGSIVGLDYSNLSIQYSITDLTSSFCLSLLLSFLLNNMKYTSWERRQKLNDMITQHEENIATISNLAETAEKTSKAKSIFLAKMSHEIRTPMNAITGMAELALRENMPTTAQEYVLTIKQASANLLSIINDILDLSKIESGKLELIPADYTLSTVVNDVVSIIRMKVVDSRVRFVVNLDSKIPNTLFGDETRIRQVLLNIMSNAVKFTKKGFISLVISGDVEDDDTVMLTIDVADTGKGMKQDDLGKLFGDFVQLDLATNKGNEGTGLGLAITKNLVEAMGGNISVYSEYSKGSTFTITLPQKIRSYEPLAIVENPEEKNVLVYERREIYIESMICTLDNLGVGCMYAKNSEDLHKKLKANTYSFIFVESSLLDNVKKILSELNLKTRIVLLTEFGNAIVDKSLSVIAMPVHSISVANILNGVSDSFSYSISKRGVIRFIAPSARILIVDDINTNLKVAEGLLSPYKMRVDLCLSGTEAIEAVKANRYDIVFMDHMMPVMDGIEATKHIRELGNEDLHYKKLPIIALTANAVSGTKEMFMESGFNDFLSKPIDMNILSIILEKWIPGEKQDRTIRNRITDIDENNSDKIKINGIDTNKGISISGGMQRYIQTLAVFHKDGMQKIEEITKSIKTGNYSLYTTYVHALKSAAANIGATNLSETAKKLEIAGKKEDISFINLYTDIFLETLRVLLDNINEVLPKEASQKKSIDFESLKDSLNELKEALHSLNSRAIDQATVALQEFTQTDIGAEVESILQNTLIGEHDEAISTINTLLKEAKS